MVTTATYRCPVEGSTVSTLAPSCPTCGRPSSPADIPRDEGFEYHTVFVEASNLSQDPAGSYSDAAKNAIWQMEASGWEYVYQQQDEKSRGRLPTGTVLFRRREELGASPPPLSKVVGAGCATFLVPLLLVVGALLSRAL